jgi:sugar lactone lactonase YvrE
LAIDDGSRGQHLCRGPHGATGPQNPHGWNLTTVAGTGVAGYSGDGGPATAAELNQPAGVAIDAAGNLYIADSLNARIRKVGLNGIITTIAGTGTAGYSGEGGPAASAALSFPDRLYFDPQGNLFFIDDQRVPKITLVGNISLFAGNGVNLGCCLPETVPTGDGGPATAALLHQPSGIAFDTQGNVLIAEVYGHRIRRVYPDGIISTLVSNICTPDGLTLDPNGNLYTANNGCFEVTKIAPDGTQTVIAGSQGNTAQVCGDPLGDDGPAQFVAIEGGDVFWNAAGRLLVGDNYYEGGFLSGYVQTLTPANIFSAWVLNVATGCRSFPAPGEIVSIRWLGMGPQGATAAVPDANDAYPKQLAGTTVLFDGIPAPILYVDQTEVRTIIPFRTANQAGTVLQVVYQGHSSNSIVLQSHVASPGLFTLASVGQAAALNQDFTSNSGSNPA